MQNKKVLPYLIASSFFIQSCAMQLGAEIQWDSRDQILISESSQVKMRSIQTRVYETTDSDKLMRAIIATLQDLHFDLDLVDNESGIITGKKLYRSGGAWENNPTYYTYDTDDLIIFSTNYRTYGPFQYRNDLTRISVTIRPKGTTQLNVRANIQHNLRAVEDPKVYQHFFKLLTESQFLSSSM